MEECFKVNDICEQNLRKNRTAILVLYLRRLKKPGIERIFAYLPLTNNADSSDIRRHWHDDVTRTDGQSRLHKSIFVFRQNVQNRLLQNVD